MKKRTNKEKRETIDREKREMIDIEKRETIDRACDLARALRLSVRALKKQIPKFFKVVNVKEYTV